MPAAIRRMEELGLQLPPPPPPVAAYVPAVRSGRHILTAGQIPFLDGELIAVGPVPSAVSLEQGQQAAAQCALNGLAVIAELLEGDLDRITRIVRLGVFVASEPGFYEQPKVANGASELLHAIFGEPGRHVRSAVGCLVLPLNASVEVEMTVEVES